MQSLEGPIGPCPFGDIALGRDVFVICVEGDVREGDNEEVEVGCSEGLADKAYRIGGVPTAERGRDVGEIK